MPDWRERWRAMASRARERMTTAPDYPDDSETLAELAEWTKQAWPLQVEAMQLTDAWWDEHGDELAED